MLDFGWSVLTHQPFSTDLAPSDFHLFPVLQNTLNNKKITYDDQVKPFKGISDSLKPAEFYERKINKVSDKQ